MNTDSTAYSLEELRARMSLVNESLMENLNEYFRVAGEIGAAKDALGLPHYDAARESEMLGELLKKNPGPMPDDLLKKVFNEIFRASVEVMSRKKERTLKVLRLPGAPDAVVMAGNVAIGGGEPVLFGGPCAVEGREQMRATARRLSSLGVKVLRGGAFKPRTSPYSFQGLEEEGLKILRETADEFGMSVVTEVLGARDVELVSRYADMLQIGTRNMFNYSLLKEAGKAAKPVFLKRGMMATIDEFILAAEYIYLGGNENIVLCERGIRTFETQTRNTLDLAAVALLKKSTALPVVVDLSHALGRKDVMKPLAYAALAAGADGLMFEAHYRPAVALSDCDQQLDPDETEEFVNFVLSLPFFAKKEA
jgi:3-deoxy-7-phosphoheptulonate synthase / chorismate mutase